ncbi:MAG: single-stranded DNA-binding protein [Chitinophagales bacterium]
MRGVNKVILIGHLGKDPEVRHLDGNNVVANFPIATSESYTTKEGNRVEQTEWHNIVLWRKLAEIAEKYIKKGSLVYIEGRLRTRSWDDKDGNKKYITEIVGTSMQMLDKKDGSGSSSDAQHYSGHSSSSSNDSSDIVLDEPNDDLPF